MHNSTETEIKRVVLDILDHSKPSTCERCRHYDECYKGLIKESVHFEVCQFRAWDKEKELDKFESIFAMDANGETIYRKGEKLRHD